MVAAADPEIQQAMRIRRETVNAYVKAAGVAVRPPSSWGRRAAKPANELRTTGAVFGRTFGRAKSPLRAKQFLPSCVLKTPVQRSHVAKSPSCWVQNMYSDQ